MANNTKIMIIILAFLMLGLFILTSLADFLNINLTTYSHIISNLR